MSATPSASPSASVSATPSASVSATPSSSLSGGAAYNNTYIVYDNDRLEVWADAVEVLRMDSDYVQTLVGRRAKTTRLTSGATLASEHHIVFCDTDGGAFTVTLPAGVEGTHYKLINCGSAGNDLTIDPNGTEQIWGGGAGVAMVLIDGDILDMHYNVTEGWR